MASYVFPRALALTLKFEGGYSDHPLDPGGATNLGITRATLARHRGKPVSKSEILALSRDEAAAIYKSTYWEAISGDKLPPGVDAALFDLAVNSGPGKAIRIVQTALGQKPSGILSKETLAAIAKSDPAKLIRDISRLRLGFLQHLPIFSTFGRGWSRRVAAIETAALAIAIAPPTKPLPILSTQTPNAEPTPKENNMIDTKTIFQSRTIWANLVGLTALFLAQFGFDTASFDQAKFLDAIFQIIAAGGFVASSIFRVFAAKKIG